MADGSQMEGDDAEAARYAVARNLNVKLLIDDNDVTIAGHPSSYMSGFEVAKTLEGHGLQVNTGDGEDLDELYHRIRESLVADGPVALVNKRKRFQTSSIVAGCLRSRSHILEAKK